MFTGDHQRLHRYRAGSSGCEIDDGFRCGDQARKVRFVRVAPIPGIFSISSTVCLAGARYSRGRVKAAIAHCHDDRDLPAL